MSECVNSTINFTNGCLFYDPFDQTPEEVIEYKNNRIKRIICIAIPFLSFFKPFALTKTIIKNVFTITKNIYEAAQSKINCSERSKILLKTAFKIFFFISVLLSFKIGIAICGIGFLIQSTVKIITSISNKEYKKALHSFISLVNTIALIATMIFASLELAVAYVIISGSYAIYKASYEFNNNKLPEAIANIALACIAGKTAISQVIKIQEKQKSNLNKRGK